MTTAYAEFLASKRRQPPSSSLACDPESRPADREPGLFDGQDVPA